MSAPGPAPQPPAASAAACPLCGGANGCARAAGEDGAGECWCASARIPAGVLARVPAEQRGRVCICPRCAGAAPGGAPSA